jgi:hypothetical protein
MEIFDGRWINETVCSTLTLLVISFSFADIASFDMEQHTVQINWHWNDLGKFKSKTARCRVEFRRSSFLVPKSWKYSAGLRRNIWQVNISPDLYQRNRHQVLDQFWYRWYLERCDPWKNSHQFWLAPDSPTVGNCSRSAWLSNINPRYRINLLRCMLQKIWGFLGHL